MFIVNKRGGEGGGGGLQSLAESLNVQVENEGVADIVFPQVEKKLEVSSYNRKHTLSLHSFHCWSCTCCLPTTSPGRLGKSSHKVQRGLDAVWQRQFRASVCGWMTRAAGCSFLHCWSRTGLVALPLVFYFVFIFTLQSLCVEKARRPVTFCLPTVSCFRVMSSLWRRRRALKIRSRPEIYQRISTSLFLSIIQWCHCV